MMRKNYFSKMAFGLFLSVFFMLPALATDGFRYGYESDSSDTSSIYTTSDSSSYSEDEEFRDEDLSDEEGISCQICWESLGAENKLYFWSRRENCCAGCMTVYLKNKIQSGNAKIKVISRKNNFDSDNFGGFYNNFNVVTFLRDHVEDGENILKKLEENVLHAQHWKHRDVACPECGHFFINSKSSVGWAPKPGVQCAGCGAAYSRPEVERSIQRNGKKCPYCSGIVIKSGGCDAMTCGHCNNDFSWIEAVKIKKPKKIKKSRCCIM